MQCQGCCKKTITSAKLIYFVIVISSSWIGLRITHENAYTVSLVFQVFGPMDAHACCKYQLGPTTPTTIPLTRVDQEREEERERVAEERARRQERRSGDKRVRRERGESNLVISGPFAKILLQCRNNPSDVIWGESGCQPSSRPTLLCEVSCRAIWLMVESLAISQATHLKTFVGLAQSSNR